jgi:hypothetical protein
MSDIKFYNPDPANYVSNYVPMPVDTILDSLQNEQGIYDKTFENQKEYDKIVSDVLPGYLTQNVYGQQFKQKYSPESLQDLTEKVISGQDNIRNLKKEIRKRQTQIANDPMIKVLKIDRAYSDMVDKHRLENPNSEVYPMTQLTMDQIKAGVVPTADNYGIAADYKVYDGMSDEIKTVKANINEDIKKGGAVLFPDGSMQNITTTEQVTALELARVQEWITRSFEKNQQNGQMDNIYVKAAKDAGNPNLWNDVEFRKKVFDKYTEPLLVNVFKQIKINEDVTNATPGKSPKTPKSTSDKEEKTPVNYKIVTSNKNVAVDPFVNTNGDPVLSVSSFANQPSEWNKLANTNRRLAMDILNDPLKDADGNSKQIHFTDAIIDMMEFEDGAIKIKESFIGSGTNLSNLTPVLEIVNKNGTFRQALQNYYNSKNSSKWYEESFKNFMVQAGVDKYRPEVIEKAEKKHEGILKAAYDDVAIRMGEFGGVNSILNTAGRAMLEFDITRLGDISLDDQQLINKAKKEYEKALANELKNEPEGKIYDLLKKHNERLSDSQIRFLPANAVEVKQLKNVISNDIKSAPGKFRNFITNEKLTDKQLKEIIDTLPKNKDGEIDWDKVDVGTARDPGDGLVGVFSFNGYYLEFDPSQYSLDKITEKYDPEFELSKAYNQLVKTASATIGEAGFVYLDNRKIDFKTRVNNENNNVQFEFLGPDGTPRVTNSASEMLNIFKQAKDKSNLEFELRKKDITNKWITIQNNSGGRLTSEQRQQYQTELNNLEKEKLSQTMSEAGLGKQQPQSQGNRLGL